MFGDDRSGGAQMNDVEALRDAVTKEYEEVRAVFQHLRADDLPKRSTFGVPVWRMASELAFDPRSDVRTALRVASGKRAAPLLRLSPLVAITAWRRGRLLANATRADFLAAWETTFSELFACINEIAEEPPDGGGWAEGDRARAIAYLSERVEGRRVQTRLLRQELSMPVP